MLNRAAGIFTYVAENNQLPPPDPAFPRAIELHQDTATALSK
jgi:hypothetical protein